MGLHSEAAIHRKITELASQLNLYLNQFPKHEKYGLCQQIRSCLYDMYGYMVEAQKRFHKKTALSNLDIEHEKLRWFCALAHELGYFGYASKDASKVRIHQYLVVSKLIDEIGKMIGGWIASQRGANNALQEGS